MPFRFKIWNQGNDQQTMGIRVADVEELALFASGCTQPDISGAYANLQGYLDACSTARGLSPAAYSRIVDVVWLDNRGYGSGQFFPGRTLVATYTGPERQAGGFASQCYCIIDPRGYPALARFHRSIIKVEYISHIGRDVLVVLPR